MIKALCNTRIPRYQHVDWPDAFVALPHIGDWVQGRKDDRRLRVIGVTHAMLSEYAPILLVELGTDADLINEGVTEVDWQKEDCLL